MIFSDTYWMVRPMINFRAINIDKCKQSNFPAVTLRAFYYLWNVPYFKFSVTLFLICNN
jgi:hypothetical protein